MRQTSLFDSFMKKQKQTDPNISVKKADPSERKPEIQTSQKRHFDKQDPPFSNNKLNDQPFKMQVQHRPQQNFQELINGDDFAFNAGQSERKKRKMDLEDDFLQKPISNHCEDVQADLLASVEKPKRKVGRPPINPTSTKKPPAQPQKIKRVVISADAIPNGYTGLLDSTEEFTDVTPDWATPEGCRDAKGRKPDHPDYDPTTLYVPPEATKTFTETMKQYWRIKCEHYDKLILFKLGKFYQMFYEDAAIGNRHLDLKWMGSKMHVGFPQKCLQKYAHEFVQMGFRIVIVEQLQTPQQMKERMDKQRGEGIKTQKTLKRGVTQILTKGTMVSFMDENQYLPNYLISVCKHQNLIAYALLQMGVNMIMVGYCSNIDDFKTMLFQTRPVQLLYDPDNLPLEIVQIMKQNWLNMVLTKLPNKTNVWHPMNAKNELEDLVNKGFFKMPPEFGVIQKTGGDIQKLIMSTLSGMFRYLKNILKFQYIMSAVKFSFYQKQGSAMTMIMDSQALQHLEIFQTPLGDKDALFSKIDRTHTRFGKRLLRRWLMQPLLDPMRINQRLDAIEDLQDVSIQRSRTIQLFGRLPDLEKIVNRLYHYSVKAIAQKAVYFEDVSGIRLRQFRELIQHFNKSWIAIELLRKNRNRFRSKRLIKILTLEAEKMGQADDEQGQEGLLPAVREHLAQFDQYIKWQQNVPRPQKGLVESYDMLQNEITQLKFKLDNYLQQVSKQTGLQCLKYVHTKQRYEIQIPQQLQKKRLPDMIFTSKRSGYSRYVTVTSRKLVADIEYIQQQIKQQMGLFVGYFFEEFRKNQRAWEKYIAIIAQIDCLISLSLYSQQIGGMRPNFVYQGFDIKEAKHPCLNPGDVIANDINLDSKVMLLTGPNMGGKSTLLRTTCLTVILAQMGCYVPAQSYNCEIIDRIFTRIGASDKLQEGKSTFFIEMQETKSILTYGTNKSIAIIDELGRGTSTFDGMAIAYSVLVNLIEKVQCRCLFATHYHSLSTQFQNVTNVKLKMMSYMISNERIVFLYKLKDGRAEQSFGMNVARVVKIPESIVELAKQRAGVMQEQIAKKDRFKKIKQALNMIKNH